MPHLRARCRVAVAQQLKSLYSNISSAFYSSQPPCVTPHEVATHAEPSNALPIETEVPTHHPMSWLNELAELNIVFMVMTPL